MSAQPEVWRVSTIEGIFETDLETLKQWIAEGCVLPTDKVSKGTLNWIDAGRAPSLRAAFAGDFSTPPPPPAEPAYPEAAGGWQVPPRFDGLGASQPVPDSTPDSITDTQTPPYNSTFHAQTPISENPAASANTCQNHPESAAQYICRMCSATWCEACPRFVSGKIPLCPSCGDLCKLLNDVTAKVAQSEFQASGFGLADFGRAIRYPFQHLVPLIGGALLYAFLLLAGFKGALVAWMIMFGCISHVISQVAWGRVNRSFMPDFSEFSLWDDLVMPFFLGIGITVVTWGPIIVLVVALLFGVLGGPKAPAIVPGQDMAAQAESSVPNTEDLKVLTDPNADPKKLEEANKLNNIRPGAQIAQEAERSKNQNEPGAGLGMLLPYLGAGILLGVLFVACLGWAFFYYPMALAVAGYTQSFLSVINPLVGLDTIRRMGLTYLKAFAMVVVVQVVALIVSVIIGIATSPFNLPFVGNLPANFINGTATFYFNLVIACVLGLSLFKSADRLGINVD